MRDETTELLYEYEEAFGDIFPLMCFQGCGEDEIAETIEECLSSDEPFKPTKGVKY